MQTLLAGLLRHVRTTAAAEEPPNFVQKSDPRFKELHNVIDNVCQKLQGQGIGIHELLLTVVCFLVLLA